MSPDLKRDRSLQLHGEPIRKGERELSATSSQLAAPRLAMLETMPRLRKILEPYEIVLQDAFQRHLGTRSECLRYKRDHIQFARPDMYDPDHFDNYFGMKRRRLDRGRGEVCETATFLRAGNYEHTRRYFSEEPLLVECKKYQPWWMKLALIGPRDKWFGVVDTNPNWTDLLSFEFDKRGRIRLIFQDSFDPRIKIPDSLRENEVFYDDSELYYELTDEEVIVRRGAMWIIRGFDANEWLTVSRFLPYGLFLGGDNRFRVGSRRENSPTIEEKIQSLLKKLPFRPESSIALAEAQGMKTDSQLV